MCYFSHHIQNTCEYTKQNTIHKLALKGLYIPLKVLSFHTEDTYVKTKRLMSCIITEQLISAFGFNSQMGNIHENLGI